MPVHLQQVGIAVVVEVQRQPLPRRLVRATRPSHRHGDIQIANAIDVDDAASRERVRGRPTWHGIDGRITGKTTFAVVAPEIEPPEQRRGHDEVDVAIRIEVGADDPRRPGVDEERGDRRCHRLRSGPTGAG
jgi:hypothetical protein